MSLLIPSRMFSLISVVGASICLVSLHLNTILGFLDLFIYLLTYFPGDNLEKLRKEIQLQFRQKLKNADLFYEEVQ